MGVKSIRAIGFQLFQPLFILFIILVIQTQVFSQKQNNQWHFGTGGAIDFNTVPPAFVTGSQIITSEGSASISDRNTGALLFYTNGIIVWNALNQPMPNGTGLLGGTSTLLSSTTAAVIIPKPGNPNLYYVVTVDEQSSTNGVRYSVVDMNLNGGTGAVVAGQKNILLLETLSEKLEVVPAADGVNYWLIAHNIGNSFYSYRVTSAGIQTTPVISSLGSDQQNGAGHMKMNRQFNRLALGNTTLGGGSTTTIELFDFDNSTGVFSNAVAINYNFSIGQIYGLEFSPNGKVLYVSDLTIRLVQYDLTQPTASAIASSAYQVSAASPAGLQLGPDGKIYINAGSINVINCPNNLGDACGFQPQAIANQSGGGGYGLPKWVYYPNDAPIETSNAILYSDTCAGNATQFTIRNASGVTAVNWQFGDPGSGANNVDTGFTASHIFSQGGFYNVRAILTNACGFDTLRLNPLQIFNCGPQPTITGIKINGDTCASLTISFQATGGVSSSPYFKWNFGDPASGTNDTITITGTSPSPFPTHTFSGPGLYSVCVTFQEPGLDPQTVCRTISIRQCCDGSIVSSDSCLANSIPFSFISTNTISSITWNFGDTLSGANNTATGLNPGHTFSAAGNYTIKATITSNCGTFTRTFSKVIVPCLKPCTGTIFSADSCLANGTQFRLKSDFVINAIAWNFGDPASGNTNTSAETNPRHSFSNPGKYLISATINASCGLFLVTDSITVIACPPPCAATISYQDSCVENGSRFSINSFYSVVSASWNFGDSPSGATSNTSDLKSPSHEFSKAGNYTVTAQVELSCGTRSISKPVSIFNCNCKAFVPNLLTADGNGVNDQFEISTKCPTRSFRLKIFNRWGQEIFSTENPSEKWDAKATTFGTYFYILDIQYEDNSSESLKGWVNVVK